MIFRQAFTGGRRGGILLLLPFTICTFFLLLRVLGKLLWGEPWIPAAYPPNTSLFSPLQVLTPPEAQPEPSSSGNSPRSHSPSCGGWAAGGHCSLDATLLPPLGSLAPSSLMASQPFLRSPSLAWAWGVNISREQGRVCMQASER